MSKVENLEQIIEAYGPHLHDAPYGGWRADRVIDRVVPTHCPYCAVQCATIFRLTKAGFVRRA
jgi:anaerobic selenocysteine-containing dehydrogenase